MFSAVQKQPKITILPAFSVSKKATMPEAEMNEVLKALQDASPHHVDGDIDVTITLLEKNLKIMEDMALTREVVTYLVRNVIDAMPVSGGIPPDIGQINSEIESLRNGDDSIIGACAFISISGTGIDVVGDKMTREKILQSFYTTKKALKRLAIAIAYRIFKHHNGRIRAETMARQNTEVNIYLPLTKTEIVNIISVPSGM